MSISAQSQPKVLQSLSCHDITTKSGTYIIKVFCENISNIATGSTCLGYLGQCNKYGIGNICATLLLVGQARACQGKDDTIDVAYILTKTVEKCECRFR
jgi:hypothetical protein